MSDVAPILLPLAEPPPRDRRIVVTVAVSAVLHLLVLGLVLLPWAQPKAPAEPESISVELVPPPSEVSSVEPSISSQPPSSQPPSSEEPSSEASSSQASMAPSAPSSAPSSTEPSSAPSSAEAPSSQPASSELASSAQAPSSIEPSAASSTPPPPSESSALPPSGASSAEPSSRKEAASASSAASAPDVPPARPVVIPVGQGASSEQDASADNSSASASEAASDAASAEASSAPDAASEQVLAASGAEASDGVEQGGASSGPSEAPTLADGPPPPAQDLLHAAKRFYLRDMLDAPALAKARAALKKLPPEKRLAQTCNIEAIGQIGNAGKGLSPDAMVANAFAVPSVNGTTYTVANGAFRSKQKWYGVAYDCTLSKDMTAVTSFKFHIGGEVTGAMVARYGKG